MRVRGPSQDQSRVHSRARTRARTRANQKAQGCEPGRPCQQALIALLRFGVQLRGHRARLLRQAKRRSSLAASPTVAARSERRTAAWPILISHRTVTAKSDTAKSER